MATEHLHTPEMKARAREARIATEGGEKNKLVSHGPKGGMTTYDRMMFAKRRYEYWSARYEISVKKADEKASRVMQEAQQRAVVKHSLENRMSNLESTLNSILQHLTNGKV